MGVTLDRPRVGDHDQPQPYSQPRDGPLDMQIRPARGCKSAAVAYQDSQVVALWFPVTMGKNPSVRGSNSRMPLAPTNAKTRLTGSRMEKQRTATSAGLRALGAPWARVVKLLSVCVCVAEMRCFSTLMITENWASYVRNKQGNIPTIGLHFHRWQLAVTNP